MNLCQQISAVLDKQVILKLLLVRIRLSKSLLRVVTSDDEFNRTIQNRENRNSENQCFGSTHVCVQLSDKTGEVVVFEVFGQKIPRKLHRLPDCEAAEKQTVKGRFLYLAENVEQRQTFSHLGSKKQCHQFPGH